MKKTLLALMLTLPSLCFAGDLSDDQLEKMARKAFENSGVECQIENEAPVIKKESFALEVAGENYNATRATVDFYFLVVKYEYTYSKVLEKTVVFKNEIECR